MFLQVLNSCWFRWSRWTQARHLNHESVLKWSWRSAQSHLWIWYFSRKYWSCRRSSLEIHFVLYLSANLMLVDQHMVCYDLFLQDCIVCTYHTALHSSSGQLAFGQDMIIPSTYYLVNWHWINTYCKQNVLYNNAHENWTRIPHDHNIGDYVYVLSKDI